MPNEEETKGAAGSGGADAKSTSQPANGGGPAPGGRSGQGDAGAQAQAAGKATSQAGQDAIELLKADHRRVEQLFAEYEGARGKRKNQIVQQVCRELITHTILEEEIFYPACRDAASDEEPLDEAQVEHDSAKLLIRELMEGSADDEYRDAKVKVLSEQVRHHVAEEEKPREGVFAKAQSSGVDTAELGRRIQERKQRLQGEEGFLRPTRPVSFQRLTGAYRMNQEDRMPRDYDRDRDERGRFTSDDDDRGRGRYASERSGGGGRRYRDDDDDRGRGRGGWFGDSEGHSEASRRGWDNPDHGPSGWYGDSRGHSEASRRGWESPDHGRSGWYGDREGHSEASRRGWEERRSFSGRDRDYDDDRGRGDDRRRDEEGRFTSSRGGRDFDDDRGRGDYRRRDEEGRFTSSRGRDYGDDDRGSRSRHDDDDRGRGRGGWFGDSRGHSEAARRGWEDRR